MGKRYLLRNSILLLMASAWTSQQANAAQCEYNVLNDWGGGFQAEIRITNDGADAINSWTVNWEYTDGSALNHSWNANISGENPYTAADLGWNASIAPGNSVAFGFVGSSGAGSAAIPVITGDVCGAISSSSVASSSSSVVSSSSIASSSSTVASSSSVITSSSVASSSTVASSSSVVSSSSIASSSSVVASSSSAANTDAWQLDNSVSALTFSTTKKFHVVENMAFTELSGGISDSGTATLNIALASIESGVAIRNERMQERLFEVASFPAATVTLPVDLVDLNNMAVGEITTLNVTASLSLHGVTNDVVTELKVSRLSDTRVMVQNVAPVLIVADTYDLEAGIEDLRNVASLNSIGKVVPVDFTLFFSAQ